MVLGQVLEYKKCAFPNIYNQIWFICTFPNFSKFFDESEIRKVLNCWKWPKELVLDWHKCPLVTRFKPRAWHPNSFLVPSTSSVNMKKLEGALNNLSLVTYMSVRESQDLVSVSRSIFYESRSRRFQISRLGILQINGLLKIL